jgi:methyl acetate hydrolase
MPTVLLANTWFWIDPSCGIGGLFLTQLLPFADMRTLAAHDAYEQAVYTTIPEFKSCVAT